MKKLFTTSLLFIGIYSINSQISITATQMPVSGDTLRYSDANASSVVAYTVTGTNYNWDFSAMTPRSQGLRSFKSGINTPYFILFGVTAYGEKVLDTVPIPTIPIPGLPAITLTDVYNFYSKSPIFSPTKFIAEGLGIKITGIPVPNTYSDEDELYFFPLNYNDRDSSNFRFSTITSTLVPFRYVKQGHRITQADGWGTIKTPYGTANCLRVITTQYSIDTIAGKVPIINTPFAFGFPNVERRYQWLTLGERIPYFEIIGNVVAGNFVATQYKYRDIPRAFNVGIEEQTKLIAISVFPNPTDNNVTIILPQNNETVKTSITDLQGKVVYLNTLSKNTEIYNEHKIDVSKLSKGIYVLTLETSKQHQTIKISVQ